MSARACMCTYILPDISKVGSLHQEQQIRIEQFQPSLGDKYQSDIRLILNAYAKKEVTKLFGCLKFKDEI